MKEQNQPLFFHGAKTKDLHYLWQNALQTVFLYFVGKCWFWEYGDIAWTDYLLKILYFLNNEKHKSTHYLFFFSFFILWVYAWLLANIWSTSQWKSRVWFFIFSFLLLFHNLHAQFHPFKVKVSLKHLSKQLNTSANQNGKFSCIILYCSSTHRY